MSNPIIEAVHAAEVKFEELWTNLVQHVRGDAVNDAQKLVADAKAQVSQIISTATDAAKADAAEVTSDAGQLAGDAAASAQPKSDPAAPSA